MKIVDKCETCGEYFSLVGKHKDFPRMSNVFNSWIREHAHGGQVESFTVTEKKKPGPKPKKVKEITGE